MSNKATLKPDTVGVLIGNPRRFVCRTCLDPGEEFPENCETPSRDQKVCIRCECKDPAVLRAYFIERVKVEAWERIKELAASNDRHGVVDEKLMLESTVQVLLERMADLSLLGGTIRVTASYGESINRLFGIVEVLSSQVASLCGSDNK
jgi:hypothetical protein